MVDKCEEIYVKVKTGSTYDVHAAEVVELDKEADIAIIKLELDDYYYACIDMSEQLPVIGDEIVIYGYPFGQQLNDDVMDLSISFAKGYVSSNQRKNGINRTLLDISAKAGNSGSPIISIESGNVIGILCGSVLGGKENREEINYMLPISYINNVCRE